jgi:hypothetical protein
MAQVGFPYTTFYTASGAPLSDGYIEIEIINDVQSPDGLLCRGMILQQALNSSGVVTSVPQVWPNADLLPAGSYYVLNSYTADGQLVSGPTMVTV